MPGAIKNKDQRQIDFLNFYLSPTSETFQNARQSALKAGYSNHYADNIMAKMPDWLTEANGRRVRILEKAEKNLEEFLDMPVDVMKTEDSDDEDGAPRTYLATDASLVKIKQDTTKFVAERLGKKHYATKDAEEAPALARTIVAILAELMVGSKTSPIPVSPIYEQLPTVKQSAPASGPTQGSAQRQEVAAEQFVLD